MTPCSNKFLSTDITGRSNAADWIRKVRLNLILLTARQTTNTNQMSRLIMTCPHTMVSSSNTAELHTALWYSFNMTETQCPLVDPFRGLSKVWFTVTEKGSTSTYNQGGVGFAIQDTLLLEESSCW
jgi:hypothetical protein